MWVNICTLVTALERVSVLTRPLHIYSLYVTYRLGALETQIREEFKAIMSALTPFGWAGVSVM
jgi:hypothetical protein